MRRPRSCFSVQGTDLVALSGSLCTRVNRLLTLPATEQALTDTLRLTSSTVRFAPLLLKPPSSHSVESSMRRYPPETLDDPDLSKVASYIGFTAIVIALALALVALA